MTQSTTIQWVCPECGFGPIAVCVLPVICVCKATKPSAMAAIEELPEESRQLLIGDRVKQLTDALGIPQCGGCAKRQAWLNDAHAWAIGMWGVNPRHQS